MAQRVSRAKQTIRTSAIPFALPSDAERDARLGSVLHVLYLVFNEGYTASAGESLHRVDLSSEAMRLARLLHALLPESGEVTGLLALMLLTDARRAARTGAHGEVIPLDEQDRARWDRAMIVEGSALVARAFSRGTVGPYHLQAAIAALHDEAESIDATDWAQIRALYEVLMRISENPMIALNHAVATAMVQGPETALALLEGLQTDARIAGHYRLDAVRAHLLDLAGNATEAATHYRAAASGTASIPERDYLLMKASRAANGPM